MATSKNYRTDGGDVWVIGGKLLIEEGATVEGLSSTVLPKLESIPNSTAEDVEALKADFNLLLEKLRDSGLMAT